MERPQVGRQTGKVEKGLWWKPGKGPRLLRAFWTVWSVPARRAQRLAALLLQLGSGPVSPYSVTTN